MTPTLSLIKQVLELSEAATKGPWEKEARFGFIPQWQVISGDDLVCGSSVQPSNAETIAHYRTSAPQLARMLEVAVEKLEALCSVSMGPITIGINEALAELDRIASGEGE